MKTAGGRIAENRLNFKLWTDIKAHKSWYDKYFTDIVTFPLRSYTTSSAVDNCHFCFVCNLYVKISMRKLLQLDFSSDQEARSTWRTSVFLCFFLCQTTYESLQVSGFSADLQADKEVEDVAFIFHTNYLSLLLFDGFIRNYFGLPFPSMPLTAIRLVAFFHIPLEYSIRTSKLSSASIVSELRTLLFWRVFFFNSLIFFIKHSRCSHDSAVSISWGAI